MVQIFMFMFVCLHKTAIYWSKLEYLRLTFRDSEYLERGQILTGILVDLFGAAFSGAPWNLLSKSEAVVASKGPSVEPSTKLVIFV